MRFWLSDNIKPFCDIPDVFQWADSLQGEEFRVLENRRTLKVFFGEQAYFAKIHRGTTWGEIFKNLLTLRLPVVSARNEWRALQKLQSLGIEAPRIEGYGAKGWLPSSLHSFIITRDIGPTISLEDLCAEWADNTPDLQFKRHLIKRVARIARTLHENGMCHRDLYICHFMFAPVTGKLFLIDLHRALISSSLSTRWKIKDVGGLYFSARDIGLTRRDVLRFIREYSGTPLRAALKEKASFWRRVEKRAQKIFKRGKHR